MCLCSVDLGHIQFYHKPSQHWALLTTSQHSTPLPEQQQTSSRKTAGCCCWQLLLILLPNHRHCSLQRQPNSLPLNALLAVTGRMCCFSIWFYVESVTATMMELRNTCVSYPGQCAQPICYRHWQAVELAATAWAQSQGLRTKWLLTLTSWAPRKWASSAIDCTLHLPSSTKSTHF